MRGILLCYEAVSGLRFNLAKSNIFSINAVDCVKELPDILCCKVEKLPTVYLGLLPLAFGKALLIGGTTTNPMENKILVFWVQTYFNQ